MTHWRDLPDYPVPAEDSFNRPIYDDLMAADDPKQVMWNLLCAFQDNQWAVLDLAQNLSFEFEALDYNKLHDEYKEEESQRRQQTGIELMRDAYELAGFTRERRDGITEAAKQISEGWGHF